MWTASGHYPYITFKVLNVMLAQVLPSLQIIKELLRVKTIIPAGVIIAFSAVHFLSWNTVVKISIVRGLHHIIIGV